MYFHVFSKDPKNPWLRNMALRYRGHIRWRTLMLGGVAVALGWGVYAGYHDAIFLTGSQTTTGEFSTITGQYDVSGRHNDTIYYNGLYNYQVDGQTYSVTTSQSNTKFSPTAQIAYKVANPAQSEVIYQKTPAAQFVWVVFIALTAAAIWFLVMALFSGALFM